MYTWYSDTGATLRLSYTDERLTSIKDIIFQPNTTGAIPREILSLYLLPFLTLFPLRVSVFCFFFPEQWDVFETY